jgi:hypothetical protein
MTLRSVLLPALFLAILSGGCGGDRSRRMSPMEAQKYRLQLIDTRKADISPQLAQEFLERTPAARTRGEIDAVFEEFHRRHVAAEEAERAAFHAAHEVEAAREAEEEPREGSPDASGVGP